MTKVLVTGASGFIGSALVEALAASGSHVVAASRRALNSLPNGAVGATVGNLGSDTDWSAALSDVDVVVHTAARAHITRDTADDPLDQFRKANVDGTASLARQAAAAGVKRFIFISSIGVNGGETFGQPFTESDASNPHADYAVSKLEAEQVLIEIANETGMEYVIVRPPLVYGPKAPGNLARLERLVSTGLPLPFGLVRNKRSMIAQANLVNFLQLCCGHDAAAGEIFVISDGVDVSTADIVRYMARGQGKSARLLPIPVFALHVGLKLTGMRSLGSQLLGSLEVDNTKACTLLGWTPRVTPATAEWSKPKP